MCHTSEGQAENYKALTSEERQYIIMGAGRVSMSAVPHLTPGRLSCRSGVLKSIMTIVVIIKSFGLCLLRL